MKSEMPSTPSSTASPSMSNEVDRPFRSAASTIRAVVLDLVKPVGAGGNLFGGRRNAGFEGRFSQAAFRRGWTANPLCSPAAGLSQTAHCFQSFIFSLVVAGALIIGGGTQLSSFEIRYLAFWD